jgi:plasmid stabilization system protein ParE
MRVVYHPAVQRDVRGALRYYDAISSKLGDGFWNELMSCIDAAAQNPEHYHLIALGHRRVNLQRFPYHFLIRALPGKIRITAVRHNKQHPDYGMRRR